MKLILRELAENIDLEKLGYNWRGFDFESFSKSKKLYDFQKRALENVLKVLWFYYESSVDFREGEDLQVNEKRKERLFKEYLDFGLNENDVDYKYSGDAKHKFIFEYFPLESQRLSFRNFINRAGFWMATGSGKTLVIIKLIEFLKELIKRGEIPDYDILFLTYRDDLIDQFRRHVDEYNEGKEVKLSIYDLKNYEKVKRDSLFRQNFIFYYRSDLFSDEEKEKELDFRNYFNDGKWYIILDEAHKGDKEESKRQQIFSVLSKNGFLFNFSATFDDPRDLVTTCFEYNLSTFIENGYGKRIYISEYEAKAFKEEFTETEKLKVILKAAILHTYIRKDLEKIREANGSFYHNPLMMVLVNSVNSEVADLKLFFDHLRKIAEGKFDKRLIDECKDELKAGFRKKNELNIPSEVELKIDPNKIDRITYDDILRYVFNSKSSGDIEISYNPSIKGEVAFKLNTSDIHFALMKTGGMPTWLKEKLDEFVVNHTFEEERFFEKINAEDSPINILLGSRAFYEGWDSNRPNIILFINIGVGKEAKKFVLQSIGRGVRIEPIRGERKRALCIKDKIGEDVFGAIKDFIESIETLFVFGTNKDVIETIIKEVEEFKKQGFRGREVSLFKNIERIQNNPLLIPKYEPSSRKVFEEKAKFAISEEDFNLLKDFARFLDDDRILAVEYNAEPTLIRFFRRSILEQKDLDSGEYYKKTDIIRKDINVILKSLFAFWQENLERIKEISELRDEIKHFERVVIEEAKFEDFQGILKRFKEQKIDKKRDKLLSELRERLGGDTSFLKELEEELKEKEEIIKFEDSLELKGIIQHYYLPLIVSKDERVDFIKHIIRTKSEVNFIQKLENYLKMPGNKFQSFDWWMFSKIDESLDEVYIPYYDYKENYLRKFKPDFIFWLKSGNDYFIVFVDPKSSEFTSYEAKVDWYKRIFEENGKPKRFAYNNLNCYVYCFLYTDDVDKIKGKAYEDYWFESFDKMLERLEKNGI
jgi:superfamily II DNA or RNA helicase